MRAHASDKKVRINFLFDGVWLAKARAGNIGLADATVNMSMSSAPCPELDYALVLTIPFSGRMTK